MVAEKASDHILGRGMLSPSNLKGFIHPEWQNSQR
jgi:choline dehydrogenase